MAMTRKSPVFVVEGVVTVTDVESINLELDPSAVSALTAIEAVVSVLGLKPDPAPESAVILVD
jgi:hypothetical protein